MKLNEIQIEIVQNCGAFNYDITKMANVLDQPEELIKKEMDNPDSEIVKNYRSGKDKCDYLIDKKLFDLALTGDLQALEEFENRKDER